MATLTKEILKTENMKVLVNSRSKTVKIIGDIGKMMKSMDQEFFN